MIWNLREDDIDGRLKNCAANWFKQFFVQPIATGSSESGESVFQQCLLSTPSFCLGLRSKRRFYGWLLPATRYTKITSINNHTITYATSSCDLTAVTVRTWKIQAHQFLLGPEKQKTFSRSALSSHEVFPKHIQQPTITHATHSCDTTALTVRSWKTHAQVLLGPELRSRRHFHGKLLKTHHEVFQNTSSKTQLHNTCNL